MAAFPNYCPSILYSTPFESLSIADLASAPPFVICQAPFQRKAAVHPQSIYKQPPDGFFQNFFSFRGGGAFQTWEGGSSSTPIALFFGTSKLLSKLHSHNFDFSQCTIQLLRRSCFMVLLGLLLSRLRAENVRSEVVDVTGNVNGMANTSVKVFFGTKTRRLCPPPPIFC